MTRYQAPSHVTGINCPSGNEYRANEHGVVHVKKDAPAGDHAALKAIGFIVIDDEPAAEPAPASKNK